MMNTISACIEPLIPILRCPQCLTDHQIELKEGSLSLDTSFEKAGYFLACAHCGAQYPITQDFIPVLWDAEVRQLFLASAVAVTNLAANKEIYDNFSDDYQQHTRQSLEISQRMQTATRKVFEQVPQTPLSQRIQLDFGCGPGHVLGWLKDFGFQQIGLDISLHNLRNARKNTGCLVVCGNATNMPFADGSIHLVTESSVLHHIQDWKATLVEAARVCCKPGGVILDSEPSKEQMAWSKLAVAFFNLRFPVYRVLSLFWRSKYVFRNPQQARLNLQAEIHHQPGTGFPLDELEGLFRKQGLATTIILSPTGQLISQARPKIKNILLNLLSRRNPWNPRYGAFTAIALKKDV